MTPGAPQGNKATKFVHQSDTKTYHFSPGHIPYLKVIPIKGQRVGQTLYNFIYWLQETHQMDTFNIPDDRLKEIYQQFLDLNK